MNSPETSAEQAITAIETPTTQKSSRLGRLSRGITTAVALTLAAAGCGKKEDAPVTVKDTPCLGAENRATNAENGVKDLNTKLNEANANLAKKCEPTTPPSISEYCASQEGVADNSGNNKDIAHFTEETDGKKTTRTVTICNQDGPKEVQSIICNEKTLYAKVMEGEKSSDYLLGDINTEEKAELGDKMQPTTFKTLKKEDAYFPAGTLATVGMKVDKIPCEKQPAATEAATATTTYPTPKQPANTAKPEQAPAVTPLVNAMSHVNNAPQVQKRMKPGTCVDMETTHEECVRLEEMRGTTNAVAEGANRK
jgi:hypothetical protein